MGKTTPQKRMNKLGHMVTKHVLDEDAASVSPKLASLGAPALNAASKAVSYQRAVRPMSDDPYRPGHYDKPVRTSSGKLVSLSASNVPDGADADSTGAKAINLSGDAFTAQDQTEVDEYLRVFAHEVAAVQAGRKENIPIEAELIPEGAYIDLGGCAFIPPEEREDYSFEYAEVQEVEHGPEGETILHTDQGSVAVPPDYVLPVQLQQLNETITGPFSPNQIDDATRAALSSALEDASFNERDAEEEDEDSGYDHEEYLDSLTLENVSEETYEKFRSKIERFVSENTWAVDASGLTPESFGHDFYMTASHSGVGFTDRDNIPASSRNALARPLYSDKSFSLEGGMMTLGDDGKVYFEG